MGELSSFQALHGIMKSGIYLVAIESQRIPKTTRTLFDFRYYPKRIYLVSKVLISIMAVTTIFNYVPQGTGGDGEIIELLLYLLLFLWLSVLPQKHNIVPNIRGLILHFYRANNAKLNTSMMDIIIRVLIVRLEQKIRPQEKRWRWCVQSTRTHDQIFSEDKFSKVVFRL